jgi:hypothetical protein
MHTDARSTQARAKGRNARAGREVCRQERCLDRDPRVERFFDQPGAIQDDPVRCIALRLLAQTPQRLDERMARRHDHH